LLFENSNAGVDILQHADLGTPERGFMSYVETTRTRTREVR
jgi:hypothetical protein